jgi:MarR family transcriptional regulator, organic hydroperoxide resistance regulator
MARSPAASRTAPNKGGPRLISPLHKASRQVQLHLEPACQRHGVSFQEAHLIAFVSRYPARVSVLHRVFDLRKSTLTSLLDRLEALGLLRRKPDSADGRSLIVEATARGQRVAAAIGPAIGAFEASVMGAVSERDLSGFHAVLQAIGVVTGVEVR